MAEKKWSTSNYLRRKSQNLAKVKPEWVKNPETGAEFLLRRVGALSAVLAGYMKTVPNIADEVVGEWQKQGVDVEGSGQNLSLVSPERIAEGDRAVQMMARVISEACVVPKLVPGATGEDELDPADLDDRDALFIFHYATGQAGAVKGGGVVNMADLKSVPKQPGRRVRTRSNLPQLRDAAEPVAQAG